MSLCSVQVRHCEWSAAGRSRRRPTRSGSCVCWLRVAADTRVASMGWTRVSSG